MSVTDQLLTLGAVIVGAIMSFAATSLNERQRFHREEATRWTGQKLDAYLEYLYAVKHMARIARCIAAARGINPDQPPLEREDALSLLSEAEEKRAQATEKVTLLGNEATVNAVEKAVADGLPGRSAKTIEVNRDALQPLLAVIGTIPLASGIGVTGSSYRPRGSRAGWLYRFTRHLLTWRRQARPRPRRPVALRSSGLKRSGQLCS